jgi:hypothetical protein
MMMNQKGRRINKLIAVITLIMVIMQCIPVITLASTPSTPTNLEVKKTPPSTKKSKTLNFRFTWSVAKPADHFVIYYTKPDKKTYHSAPYKESNRKLSYTLGTDIQGKYTVWIYAYDKDGHQSKCSRVVPFYNNNPYSRKLR